MSGVKLNRRLTSSGQSWSRDNPSRRHGAREWPMSGRQRKLCLRVIWTCCCLWKRHGLDTDGLNTALSLESSIVWDGTMLLTPAFLQLCQCVRVVSSMKVPNSLTLSAPFLIVFHIVFAPSFHTSSEQSFKTSWPFPYYALLGCFYLLIPQQAKCSNYQVWTPFADIAVFIVFLHCSSVIIMRCDFNSTHASGKHSRI